MRNINMITKIGNKNFYDLDSALTFFEQKQINKIINNNCKVLVEKIFFF